MSVKEKDRKRKNLQTKGFGVEKERLEGGFLVREKSRKRIKAPAKGTSSLHSPTREGGNTDLHLGKSGRKGLKQRRSGKGTGYR